MRRPSGWCGALAALALAACSGGSDDGGSCTAQCSRAGETRCSGAQLQTCQAGANGCLSWSQPAACPGTQLCSATANACAVSRLVTLSWLANREGGVNRPGGGYEIQVPGQPPLVVAYESGPAAPTSVSVRLPSGNHSATVRAFAALDASGGATRTYGAVSLPVVFHVP